MRISDWSSDVCSSDLLKLQPGESFSKASETRKTLRGNEVHAALADKKRFGDAWAHKSPEQQWAIIDRLLEEENPDTLHAFLTGDCGLDDEHAKAAARAPLPDGYGRLGETATRLILEEFKKEVITYAEAVKRTGWHHTNDRPGTILA